MADNDTITIKIAAREYLPELAAEFAAVLDAAFAAFLPADVSHPQLDDPNGYGKIEREKFSNLKFYRIQCGVENWPAWPYGLRIMFWEGKAPEVWWDKKATSRIPLAEEIEQAVTTVIHIVEFYAVGDWAQKAPGSIATLKKVHKAISE